MMNKLIFMPLLLVLIIPIVFAEENTVNVPFTSHGNSCTFDEIAIEYHCIWQGTPDKMTRETLEEFKDNLTVEEYIEALDDILEEEAKAECFDNPECPLGIYNPTPEPETPLSPESASEKALIEKINNILAAEDPRCYQGFGTTTGVQQVRDFSIPVHTITRDGKTFVELDTSVPTGAMNYGGLLKEILTHGQECKAQLVLNNMQGGVLSSQDYQSGFCDLNSDNLSIEESVQAGCGMSSGAFYHNLRASVPEWSQARTSQESNFGIDMSNNRYDIVEDICEGYYTNSYKMTFKECREIRDSKIELSGGHVPDLKDYGIELEAKVNLYKEDGGKSMAKDIAKQILEDKVSQLMKQLRAMENQSD